MRNKLNRNHLLGLAFIAGVCAIFSLGAAIAPPWASATNAATAVTSTCIDGRWTVRMSVTSQYDGVIHVVLEDPHSPVTHSLQPHETFSVKEQPDAGSKSWTWRWSSPDGHLLGDAISGTLPRPVGCDVVPSTTVASTPTTEVTTSPSTPPTSALPSPSPVTVAPTVPPSSTSPTAKPSPPPPSTSTPINLPATGSSGQSIALAAAGFGLVGVALVTTTRRRKRT